RPFHGNCQRRPGFRPLSASTPNRSGPGVTTSSDFHEKSQNRLGNPPALFALHSVGALAPGRQGAEQEPKDFRSIVVTRCRRRRRSEHRSSLTCSFTQEGGFLMEPRKAAKQEPKAPEVRKEEPKPKLQIVKLEERITPTPSIPIPPP